MNSNFLWPENPINGQHILHLVVSPCRKSLQRSGKDHSVLLVLPSGIYRYRFIVDGESRYIPDLPFIADEMGHVCNLLDVHVCIYFFRPVSVSLCFHFSFIFYRPRHPKLVVQ